MADTIFNLLSGFFARYGYWVIFFGVMLENAGLPVPGETVLLFAGFLAYQGEIDLVPAMLTAIAGATLGDSGGYLVGRYGGTAVADKYCRRFFPKKFDKAQALFRQHGHWAVFVARFITGLRVFSGILAGMFRMKYLRFLIFNFTGAVLWAFTISSVGFLFGSSWESLVHFVKEFHRLTLAVLVAGILIAVFVYVRRRQGGRRAPRG